LQLYDLNCFLRPATIFATIHNRKENSMSGTDLKNGREMRRKLLGGAYVDRIAATTYKDTRMQGFIDLASETIFGALWTRPGLDLKTRTLITVISDVSTGQEAELEIHLRMALRQGWTEEELTEAMLHLMGYLGAPLVRGAMLVAVKVFEEVREELRMEKSKD